MKSIVLIIATATFLSSCSSEDSFLKEEAVTGPRDKILEHIVTPIQARMAACDYEKTDSKFPKALEYVRGIAKFLMDANPDVFQGYFKPSEICITISNSGLHGASADTENGHFTVSPRYLAKIPNDIEVAGVIAHELGHIVNNRNNHPLNQPRQLLANPEYKKLNNDLLTAFQDHLEESLDDLTALHKRLLEDKMSDQASKVQHAIIQAAFNIAHFGVRKHVSNDLVNLKRANLEGAPSEHEAAEIVEEAYEKAGLENPSELVKLKRTLASMGQRFEAISPKHESLKSMLIDEVSYMTAGETEADISGFGMFISAGLQPIGFYQSRLRWQYGDQDQFSSPQKCLEALKSGVIPKMQNHYDEGYASYCYQLYTLTVVEPKFYEQVLPSLLKGKKTKIPNTVTLEEVRREFLENEE